MDEEIWTGSQGTLSVYVSKARDLPNLIKLDKQNVMLRLRIGHMTRESDTLYRAGQNPVFDYLERFDITPEVKPIMYVEVYCDRKKKGPLPIGKCEIDLLNGIRADPKEGYCTWYELKRDRDEFAGTIFIELTFVAKMSHTPKEKMSRSVERLDMSMASRPVPPLPSDIPPLPKLPTTSPQESYIHGSEVRQFTPSIRNLYSNSRTYSTTSSASSNGNDVIRSPPNFMSSIATSDTVLTDATNTTSVTTSSDTKFHFANLRKLKEKINIFRNPNNLVTDENTGNPVDIEALQKAIGVTTIHDEDDEEDITQNDVSRQTSASTSPTRLNSSWDGSKLSTQPPLPPLPDMASISPSSRRTSSPRIQGFHTQSPTRYSSNSTQASPKLPVLPNSPGSVRRNSHSPLRRRVPPRI
ncbi:Inn1p NDAI_0F03040 [Naumovozyma dairenensis CBS 421]|uniref:C2 domain-containing protein n=1 Tax=Naumovozyma dairenensis (strain ATCC 10597 / BCRC 20456 / CBS 421 / NBRC 0211 / NRRL Y-12639) TaxID=1071378 RepID=G0WCW1_NAUDC|nr:hypothetical protein NDAI_0F03040 [Naumovozyma dairenensis CBS 421]CCD25622.1 hypothetical protein NDAI_0F03040 [Naumovozyma dairenensis CBS 421]